MALQAIGRLLVIFGAILVFLGVVFLLMGKVPGLGKLPGDFCIKRGNFTFYFPLATCLLISFVISFILFIFTRK